MKPIQFIVQESAKGWHYQIKLGPLHKPLTSATYSDLSTADKAARIAMDALRNRERQCQIVSPKKWVKM